MKRQAFAPWYPALVLSNEFCGVCALEFSAEDEVTVVNPILPTLVHDTEECRGEFPDGLTRPFSVEEGRIIDLRRKVIAQAGELARLERSRKAMRKSIQILQDEIKMAHVILDEANVVKSIHGFNDAEFPLDLAGRLDVLLNPALQV